MIFQRISYRLATQFTAFVFVLLLITGGIFLGVDMANRRGQMHRRLEEILRPILEHPERFADFPASIPPFRRDRIRIVDAAGRNIFSGLLYENVPPITREGISIVNVGGESYDILTIPVTRKDQLVGYIQVGDRSPPDDLFFDFLLFLLISGGISTLTFGVGLSFARRSLKPAREMVERLEQFTQDASHELRTPITAVSTSLDLALATNDYPENIRTAKKDLKEVAALVDRLLELARLDKYLLEKEDVDLSALVTESIEKHRQFALEKDLVLGDQIAPGIHVEGDPTLIRQILSNLLTNAIKFNTLKGRIDVKLTADTLMVRDTGKGISSASLPHIFNRFYQEEQSRTKKSKDGLGLGLALVKRIVELHGWSITAKSALEEGTTFTIRLSQTGKSAKH